MEEFAAVVRIVLLGTCISGRMHPRRTPQRKHLQPRVIRKRHSAHRLLQKGGFLNRIFFQRRPGFWQFLYNTCFYGRSNLPVRRQGGFNFLYFVLILRS